MSFYNRAVLKEVDMAEFLILHKVGAVVRLISF